jgi:hypothetical protein
MKDSNEERDAYFDQDPYEHVGKPPKPPRRVLERLLAGAGGVLLVSLLGCVSSMIGLRLYFHNHPNEVGGEDADLAQSKVLTQACENYKVDKDVWPTSLKELTQPRPGGSPPYLEPDALRTKCVPGEFNYDASGAHHNGLKPDIWVNGPHGQIGNWMQRVGR